MLLNIIKRGSLFLAAALVLFFATWSYLLLTPLTHLRPLRLYAQTVFELSCPAGTTSLQALQTFNQSTGKYRQNYCIDANGNVFESTASSLSSSVVDATATKYGLKADVKRCNGWGGQATLTITNASTTVICSTANFTNADVGKIIWASNWSGADSAYVGTVLILTQTTIQSVTNSTTVVVANAAIGSTTGTNGSLFWGSDDTAALALAWTD